MRRLETKDKNGYTALINASQDGYVEIVKLLLAKGAQIASKDKCGGTALMRARWSGKVEVVKLLCVLSETISTTTCIGDVDKIRE